MNYLYGKFEMDPIMLTHLIFKNDEISKHMSKDNTTVKKLIGLNNNKSIISILYSNPYEDEEVTVENININIGIASAITSYAIIYMSSFYQIISLMFVIQTQIVFLHKPHYLHIY
jgi:hypothetical protein